MNLGTLLELSHTELRSYTKDALSATLKTDSLLSDLPSDIIQEEVAALIAVEHGQSITVFISREQEPALKVIVPQDSKVCNLKKAIARHFKLYQQRVNNNIKISWKYIWKTYNISYDGLLMEQNDSKISDYGVYNKTVLKLVKKRNRKNR